MWTAFCLFVLGPLSGLVAAAVSLVVAYRALTNYPTSGGSTRERCDKWWFVLSYMFGCVLAMILLWAVLNSLSPDAASWCTVLMLGTVFGATGAWTRKPKLREQARVCLKALLFGSDPPPKPTQPTGESDISRLQRQVTRLLEWANLTDEEHHQRQRLLEEIAKHTDQVCRHTDEAGKRVAACGDMAQRVKALKQHQLSQEAQAALDSAVATNHEQVIEKLKSVKTARLELERIAGLLTLDLAKQRPNRLSPEEALAAANTAIWNADGLLHAEAWRLSCPTYLWPCSKAGY